jgi:hypothetical protein
MKICSVTPVHKLNKPKDEIKSYRSVSKNFMKLFEALILNNINSFTASNNVITHTHMDSILKSVLFINLLI